MSGKQHGHFGVALLLTSVALFDFLASQHPSISCEEFYTLATATGISYRTGGFVNPDGHPRVVSTYRDTSSGRGWRCLWQTAVTARDNNNHPPLYFVIVRALLNLGLSAEWALRVPSVLAHLGAVYLLYVLILEFRSGPPALAAAAGFAYLPEGHFYAHEGRSYTLMMAIAIGATVILIRLLRTKMPVVTRFLYVVLLVLGCLTHYLFVLIVICHILVVLVTSHERPVLVRLATLYLIVGCCVSPWYLWAGWHQAGNRSQHLAWLTGTSVDSGVAVLRTIARLLAAPELGVVGIVSLSVWFCLGLFGLWVSRTNRTLATLIVVGIGLTPLSLWLVDSAIGTRSISIERYWLLITPFWALAVAVGLSSIRSKNIRTAAYVAWVVTMTAHAYGVVSGRISRSPDQHRELAVFLDTSPASQIRPVLVEGNIGLILALAHYSRTALWATFFCTTDGVDGRNAAITALSDTASLHGRLLVRSGRGALSRRLEQEDVGVKPIAEFGHVMVYQLLASESIH